MLKTSILVGFAAVLFASQAMAEKGVGGGQPRCPEGSSTFVKTLSHEELKSLFGPSAKACRTGTQAAYFVCPVQKKFDVSCLNEEDIEFVASQKAK